MQELLAITLVAVLAFSISVMPPQAEGSPDGALESTVLGQIEALKARDYEAAFEYASDGIKAYFGSPENFARMLNNGYEMVLDPKNVEFLDNRPDGRFIWQRVMLTTWDGEIFVLDYQMVPAREGWKINSVVRLQDLSQSA